MIRTGLCLAILCACLGMMPAHGQVLVYKLEMTRDKGINYHPFDGGYFVAPLLGGSGSFLLTSSEDQRVYVAFDGGGSLFTAVNGSEKKAVMSSTTGGGTASGAMVAIGDINHVVHVRGPTFSLDARVARSLHGTAVSADDESTAEGPAEDGSLGAAGFSSLKLTLDEDETSRANDRGSHVGQTLEQLRLVLERQGFVAGGGEEEGESGEDEEEPAPVLE